MRLSKEQSVMVKIAIDGLFHTEEGELLIELLKEECGIDNPTYDIDNPTSFFVAAGRTEIFQYLMGLDILTVDQIENHYKESEDE